MNRLQDKVAVITGGTTGIGLATAKEFIAQGAKVIITGRSQASVDQAITELGEQAYGFIWDATDSGAIYRFAEFVQENFTSIDILFINAGVAKFATFEQMTPEIFDESVNTNVKGAYFTIQALLPFMDKGGSIVLNTSINAHIGAPGASVYAATKAAVLTLAKNLSVELISRNIRVNAISPGPIQTPLHTSTKLGLSEQQVDQMNQGIIEKIPLHRFGRPEEIAKVALFFASDDSSFVVGAELIVDGGMTL
ncbi:SDR family oxidoreductase [Spirosoma endbachense]|uniref:SDR family oxidoreductase n=1 Tax=Spirosoma endbachense TaxID=2666025 RepID=A0A6P1VYP3_9BACT|nr:SDR family oxidoreductase [Spirosoma endbachense]QHV96900.1 SDR family oxidoreductase [Spirosoma endbachense]